MPSSVCRAALALATSAVLLSPASLAAQGAQRVYVVLADSVPMTVSAASTAIAESLKGQGWTILATHTVGVDATRCSYAARVVVARQAPHTAAVMAKGALGAFAVPVRIGVFEDERGVHVSMVNPLSVERTMVAESGLEASGRAMVEEVAGLVVAATRGRKANRSYGQSRDRGLIGKTMGVMAGGPFAGQLETITSVAGSTPADVRRLADGIWQRLQQPPKGKWQLHGIYRIDLDDQGVVILGVSGAAMETKAFAIVGAGDDDTLEPTSSARAWPMPRRSRWSW
ncbi:MAG: hypothetical protein IPP90_09785 [Gemmatimonadaceae bacterium]|nr:hypothetical protein [Gemmatimonadaceae bacterium]